MFSDIESLHGQPTKQKENVFLFVFMSFVPSKDSTILQ